MLHSINDISILLNVSKMTIYRKLKAKEFKSYIIIKQGVQYLDDDDLTLLTQMLKNKCEYAKIDVNDTFINEEIAIDRDDYITYLKSKIEIFRKVIQEKNLQINNLNNRLCFEQDKPKDIIAVVVNLIKPGTYIEPKKNYNKELGGCVVTGQKFPLLRL